MTTRFEIAQNALKAIFAQQQILKTVAPDYNWNGLGNLLGDFGELIAIEQYGLQKAPTGAKGYDAVTPDGKTVQIKTSYASKQVNLRPRADILLVVHVDDNAAIEEVYYGDYDAAFNLGTFSKRDNKTVVTHSKLVALKA